MLSRLLNVRSSCYTGVGLPGASVRMSTGHGPRVHDPGGSAFRVTEALGCLLRVALLEVACLARTRCTECTSLQLLERFRPRWRRCPFAASTTRLLAKLLCLRGRGVTCLLTLLVCRILGLVGTVTCLLNLFLYEVLGLTGTALGGVARLLTLFLYHVLGLVGAGLDGLTCGRRDHEVRHCTD